VDRLHDGHLHFLRHPDVHGDRLGHVDGHRLGHSYRDGVRD
jgi:hypothetical protein